MQYSAFGNLLKHYVHTDLKKQAFFIKTTFSVKYGTFAEAIPGRLLRLCQ